MLHARKVISTSKVRMIVMFIAHLQIKFYSCLDSIECPSLERRFIEMTRWLTDSICADARMRSHSLVLERAANLLACYATGARSLPFR